jgi:hypothetical protein
MSGKYWITEPNGYLDPVIDKSGEGAKAAKTVIQVFQNTVSKHGDRSALALKRKPEVCYLLSPDAATRTDQRHHHVALSSARRFDRQVSTSDLYLMTSCRVEKSPKNGRFGLGQTIGMIVANSLNPSSAWA